MTGKVKQAELEMHQLQRTYPGKHEVYELLMQHHIRQGDSAAAKRVYQEAIRKFPEYEIKLSPIINQDAKQ